MNDPMNFNHDELLDRATRALREASIPDGPPPELVAKTLAAGATASGSGQLELGFDVSTAKGERRLRAS